jgi:hypothetical protein
MVKVVGIKLFYPADWAFMTVNFRISSGQLLL